jgi:hypothetical protein
MTAQSLHALQFLNLKLMGLHKTSRSTNTNTVQAYLFGYLLCECLFCFTAARSSNAYTYATSVPSATHSVYILGEISHKVPTSLKVGKISLETRTA